MAGFAICLGIQKISRPSTPRLPDRLGGRQACRTRSRLTVADADLIAGEELKGFS
jgi:hypothetical protein